MWQKSIAPCVIINHPNIQIKHLRLFQNNNKMFLIIKSWDTWQHITYSHYSQKKSHLSCKRQYVYDKSKDENVFHSFFFHPKCVVVCN
jgi:hypothetical protein